MAIAAITAGMNRRFLFIEFLSCNFDYNKIGTFANCTGSMLEIIP